MGPPVGLRHNRAIGGAGEILTIGHSTHPLERFLALLEGADVDALADVRRFPGSRRNPQFASEALADALQGRAIAYRWLGDTLGGRRRPRPHSPNDAWRVAAFRAYADHTASEEFRAGLAALEGLARERRTAFMCAEGDWRRCHRRLIADALVVRDWTVMHITPTGGLQTHELPEFATVSRGRLTYAGQAPLRRASD